MALCRLSVNRSRAAKGERMMTGLGAVMYGGFFLLAALWLFLTSDYDAVDEPDQAQRPDRSNSASAPADRSGRGP